MKARITILFACVLMSSHISASAQWLAAGLFNSPKGYGICIDHSTSEMVYNSYTLYADAFGMYSGEVTAPGIKVVYLHYNRFASFNSRFADYDLFLAPGASTGYVRDRGSDGPGFLVTTDIAVAFRATFKRKIDIEFGMFAELGFKGGSSGGKTQLSLYNNGLMQALYPTLKIMMRF